MVSTIIISRLIIILANNIFFLQAIEIGDFDEVKKWFSEQKHRCSEIINRIVLNNFHEFGDFQNVRCIHLAALLKEVDILEYFLQNGAGKIYLT